MVNGPFIELGVHHPKSIPLFCDSPSVLHIAKNLILRDRMKHIEVTCHLVRYAINDDIIAPSYVPKNVQLVDTFTEALDIS